MTWIETKIVASGVAHQSSAFLDGFDDILITGATTQITFQPLPDLRFVRITMVINQINGTHHHAGCAKPALQPMTGAKSLLHRVELISISQTLNGSDLSTLKLH